MTSAPVASAATALAALCSPGATFLLDVFLPADVANPSNAGSLQLFVSARSHGIHNAYLGMVKFQGTRLGTYRTVRFAIPDDTRQLLAAAPFSDLTFEFHMVQPGKTGGTYRLDHLRARAFDGAPEPGPGQSVDLVAELTAGGVSTPGSATFPAGVVQVPQSFHVHRGNAGHGTAELALGFGGTPFVTCTYGGSATGGSYDLVSCTGGFQPGDLVGASNATLTIRSASASGAKIRAQLALNPVGDLVGPGIIPPMPTWWGECVSTSATTGDCDASSASQIVTDYFELVAANPPFGSTVKTPVGEFARRSGDGSPHDNLTGPPPPNDPPWDQEGHLNRGGDWDAYWRLQGTVASTVDPTTHNNHNTLTATLGAHAVLWGQDLDVVGVTAEGFTDSGQITTAGFTGQNSGGSLSLELFGATLSSGGGSIPTGGSFNFDPKISQNLDLPPIRIWIFTITIGVNAELEAKLSGNVNPLSMGFAFTPSASVGAHLEGDIDLGIASGGVSATIDLLKVTTPLDAHAITFINTAPAASPGGCQIGVNLLASAKLQLTSLGGHVELEASFGVCPFCYSDSWTLFSWDGVALANLTLFSAEAFPSTSLAAFESTLCKVALVPTIDAPAPALNVAYGIPLALQSHAVRPATPGVSEQPIDCNQGGYDGTFAWATSDANDQFSDPVTGAPGPSTGCHPLLTFAKDQPTRTVTLNVIDQFGEAGSTQVNVNVVAPPPGPNPFISGASPATTSDGSDYVLGVSFCGGVPTVHLVGGEFNGALPVTLDWTVTRGSTGVTTDLGPGTASTSTDLNGTTVNTTVDWTPTNAADTYTITLTATDGGSITRTKTITVHLVQNPC